MNERHRGSLLNVEITGFLIKDLPPLPQRSAWAIYDACPAQVSCNDAVKCACVGIHPVCECFVPEQPCLRCHGPGVSACSTNTLKKLLIPTVRPFSYFQHKRCRARLFAQAVSNASHVCLMYFDFLGGWKNLDFTSICSSD